MVVCTLCSCYPWAVLGLPPTWYQLPAYRSRAVVEPRLERLWEAIEGASKSSRWKMRNRVGDKVRWYEEPEEVG